jgi:hypothetical protein
VRRRQALHVDDQRVGSSPQVRAPDVKSIRGRRIKQRGPTKPGRTIDVRASLEQQLDQLDIPGPGRRHQRCDTNIVRMVDVGAGVDEHFTYRAQAPLRSCQERHPKLPPILDTLRTSYAQALEHFRGLAATNGAEQPIASHNDKHRTYPASSAD